MHFPTHPLISHMHITFFLHKCTGHTFLANITPFACEWLSLIHCHLSPSSITCHLSLSPVVEPITVTCCQTTAATATEPAVKPTVTHCYPSLHPLLPLLNCCLPVGGQISAYVIIATPVAACHHTCLLGGQKPCFCHS